MARDATRTTAPRALLSQLGTLLRVTGARPRQWILGTVAASVVLAAAAAVGAAGAAAVVLPVCANTGKARAVSREATMTDLVFMAISF